MGVFLRKHLAAIILLFVGAAVITGAYFLLSSRNNTIARDLQRLADMHITRSAFARLYQDEASYVSAGCDEGSALNTCVLASYDEGIVTRQDPSGAAYEVVKAPDDASYRIKFILERSYGALEAGEHFLSQTGIQ